MRAWLDARPRLGLGLGLGLGVGGAEVAARAGAVLGMSVTEVLHWWLLGVGTSVVLGLAVALLFRWSRAPVGPVLAVLLGVHGFMVYRYAIVLNHYLLDPEVWGGALGIGALAVALGWAGQRALGPRSVQVVRCALGVGLLTLPAALWRAWPVPPEAQAVGPNVLLITVDTLRADRIGVYGSSNRTPAMDALAKTGARFEAVVSTAPLTQPAHLSILTGRPPHVTGVVSNGTDIGERRALLSRVLSERGWTTAGFVGGFPLHSRFGWGQDMGVYDDDFGEVPGLHRLNLVRAWDLFAQRSRTLRERRGSRVVDRAVSWLDRQDGAPFFLWLHLFDPHAPYEAPGHTFDPPTAGAALDLPGYWPPSHRAITSTEWLSEAYDAEVRYVDGQIGRLLAVLRHRGQLDETLVVLTADHGESLTEHGLLFDHGDDLMEPSLRVPLIFHWPGKVAPGVLRCLGSNMDTAPTVLGLLGITDGLSRHGVDRSKALRGGECTDSPVLATTVSGRFVDPAPIDHALRWPGSKRILSASGTATCWRVPAAVGGEKEMQSCPPGMVDAMQEALEAKAPPQAPRTDPETIEALRALGYIE